MKKGTFLMALAIAGGMASCAQGPQANMKNEVDTLSYMMGVTNTQGLKDYAFSPRMGVDSAHYEDFIRGIEQGVKTSDPKDLAYLMGMQIGVQVSGQMFDAINNQVFEGDSVNSLTKENFLAGFLAAVREQAIVSTDSASLYVRTQVEAIKDKALAEKYADYKKQNEEFLATNKTKEGVKTTASGLQYKVIKEGKGKVPTAKSRVKVHYRGTLIDGTEFDTSYKGKEPRTFRADQVIKGWTEALTMMPVGSKWELYIPQELAYGSMDRGQIKPFSTLIFEIELIDVEETPAKKK